MVTGIKQANGTWKLASDVAAGAATSYAARADILALTHAADRLTLLAQGCGTAANDNAWPERAFCMIDERMAA